MLRIVVVILAVTGIAHKPVLAGDTNVNGTFLLCGG
jgi:hypothetical protein